MIQNMSYITERRVEEKERRRNEILDAAEILYAKEGWDAVTMDQIARGARLSRALVYVYFRDKEELLFAIGERAMHELRSRFVAAAAGHNLGMDKVQAIGRAYMTYAYELPHYFDVCSRFNQHGDAADAGTTASDCGAAGDLAIAEVVKAIEVGKQDGSVRADVGDSMLLALSLWAFTHGIVQIATSKAREFERMGVASHQVIDYAFGLIGQMIAARALPV
jgi:AcrR family transcriptional regulator